ncbi:S8 family serine peptidase [Cellulomonas sp. NS3]|uniref:S8 family serine peptidase n=1 Tax=Cellulomonas sp. NS3 TaxID=2973977 RepID=UPI002162630E|nr:S8 family serine peptidase [Cellulomonas sp. NS3]
MTRLVAACGLAVGAALVAPLGVVAAAGAPPAATSAATVPDPDPRSSTLDDSVLRAPRAWQVSSGKGVTVAVLDSGVDAAHPDLQGALLPGFDAVDGAGDVSDLVGSGTGVAGVIAARSNGVGIVGLAYESSILPVRVTRDWDEASDARVVAGVRWAVSHGARVLHVSHAVTSPDSALRTAISDALAAGVVVVTPAGDGGSDVPQYPAAWASELPGLVAVSVTTNDLTLAHSASWGEWVTVAAPGEDVPVTRPGNQYNNTTGSVYAAARVSGVVALIRAHEPALTPAQVAERLRLTAQDTGPGGADPFYGNGIVDAAAAVTLRDAVPAAPGLLPVDRQPGDGGEDDLPSGARPVEREGTGSAEVAGVLESEGDVDWYAFEAPEAARYQLRVTGLATVELCDVAGRPIVHADGYSTGLTLVDGAGPWLLRVHRATGQPGGDGYGFRLVRYDPQPRTSLRFDRGTLVSPRTFHGSEPAVVVADVTGDGVADAVMADQELGALPDGGTGTRPAVGYYVGRPDGTFDAYRRVALGTGRGLQPAVVTAQLDADAPVEVVATTDSGVWTVDLGGAAAVARSEAERADWYPGRLTAADVDADGDQDLFGTDATGVVLLRNDGSGRLTPTSYPSAPASRGAAADIDGDGRLDLVLGGGQVLRQRADASFEPAAPLGWLTSALTVVAGDVTGDGRTDLAGAFADGSLRLSAGAAAGWAAPVTIADIGGTSVDLQLADLDRDGRTDLVASPPFRTSLTVQQPDGTFLTDVEKLGSPNLPGARAAAVLDSAPGGPGLLFVEPEGLMLARQQEPVPGPAAWVTDVSPVTSARGVAVRPTVRVALGPDVDPASVSGQTVRLLDGVTRAAVAVQRTVQPDGVVRLVPTADLVAGRSYQVVVQGLRSAGGVTQDERVRTWFTVAAGGDRFTPLPPTRVFDSRDEYGPVAPGEPVGLGFADLLPVDATAVVLNVTASNPSAVGNVRVYPLTESGEPPLVSNLNVVPGVDQPASVTVRLGLEQAVELMTEGTTTDLVLDVAGYYSPDAATAYTSASPVRVLDTRTGAGGVPRESVRAGRWVELQVAGRGGVPADAAAVVLNITGTQVTGPTHVRVYPAPAASEDQTPPEVSSLNLQPARDQANLVTVRVGDGGRIRLYSHSAAIELVADLMGWYSVTGQLGFEPLEPTRIADTRTGLGMPRTLRAGQPAELTVAGVAGVPAGASASVLTVTAASPRDTTHVRVFPVTSPATLPETSALNLVPRRDEANASIARLGVGGRIGLYTHSADTDLVVDVSGYFTR